MKELTEIERAYLAGFFDGEGCIYIACNKMPHGANPTYRLRVIFSQADKPFLMKWRERLGVGHIYETNLTNPLAKRKSYQWVINGGQAEAVLQCLFKYLDIKRTQADIALRFRKTKHGYTGPERLPRPIRELRERYKEMLHAAKEERGGPLETPSEIAEYERLQDSQLEMQFDIN